MRMERLDSAADGLRKAASLVNKGAQKIANLNTAPQAPVEKPSDTTTLNKTKHARNATPTDAVITLKSGQIMYQANLEVLKRQDEMRGRAADLLA